MKTLKNTFIILITTMTLWGCATLYDHYTFTETLNAKFQVENLVKNSNTPYENNLSEIDALKIQLQKMVAYEQVKKKNEITQKMWEYLNRENSSIHKFLKTWKSNGTLSPAFAEEFAPQISKPFDLMIDYESKKNKQSENAILSFIKNL